MLVSELHDDPLIVPSCKNSYYYLSRPSSLQLIVDRLSFVVKIGLVSHSTVHRH